MMIKLNELKRDMVKKLPSWFNARRKKESSTKAFVEVFASEFFELYSVAKSAYNMTNLDTFENIDFACHKTMCSDFRIVIADSETVDIITTEREFVRAIEKKERVAFYDEEVGVLYLSSLSDSSIVNIDNKETKIIPHRIWNADIIDEFGLIYDMPRLDKESNNSYLKRLSSYKNKPASSSFHGIASYIGHSMSRYKEIEWVDGGVDIIISSDFTICSFLYVDNIPFHDVKRASDTSLSLRGDSKLSGKSRKITYFYGFDMEPITSLSNEDKA